MPKPEGFSVTAIRFLAKENFHVAAEEFSKKPNSDNWKELFMAMFAHQQAQQLPLDTRVTHGPGKFLMDQYSRCAELYKKGEL